MNTWRLQVERARARSKRLAYLDLDERLYKLGVAPPSASISKPAGGAIAQPSRTRLKRKYATEIRVR